MNPPIGELFYTTLLRLIPDWAIAPIDAIVASKASALLRTFRTLAGRISNGIIQKAIDDPEGLAEKDIIGLLGMPLPYYRRKCLRSFEASSRLSNDEKKRMSQDAMMAQMAYETSLNPIENQLTDYVLTGRSLLAGKIRAPTPSVSFCTSLHANQMPRHVSVMRSAKC